MKKLWSLNMEQSFGIVLWNNLKSLVMSNEEFVI